ncbi:hypothetical protein [Acinetobacter piscicola]|uniref:hypothetical protein n=1 Tax=Acinetobacter piscicola TaxID=2006115 RepID=UPI000B7EE686|nr:hypothetical protein [Acinetobacter piscicola]
MFIPASEAKRLVENSNLNIGLYKMRLAQLIEDNAKQGNTVVFTVLPKHLALENIRGLSSELTQLGYHIRFEVNESFYSFNVFWN